MKTFVFWVMVISMMLRVTAFSTVTVHFVPIMVWKGLTEEGAAFLLGAFAFINLGAHFFLGWIADKVNKPGLLSVCQFLSTKARCPPAPCLHWQSQRWRSQWYCHCSGPR